MLNQNPEVSNKLQSLLNQSHESIQAIWTDGHSVYKIFTPEKLNMVELQKFLTNLEKLFPDLDREDTRGMPTKVLNHVKGWDYGYYAEK